MNGQTAQEYDLSLFTSRPERDRCSLKVVKNKKQKKLFGRFRVNMKRLGTLAITALLLGLVVAVLVSQTTATVLTDQVRRQKEVLVGLENQYAYLNNKLEMKANAVEMQDYARHVLGLGPLERGQVSYVFRNEQEVIIRNKTGLERFADKISAFFQKIAAYFTS